MKNKHLLFLIVGETGSGKDTVVKELNMNPVISYTTRPKRDTETNGKEHYFISDIEMDQLEKSNNIFAWTRIGNIRYCSTIDEVLKKDIYIINPDGIDSIIHNTVIKTIVIGITAPYETRVERCKNRSDFNSAFLDRVSAEQNDFDKFKVDTKYDYLINNKDLNTTVKVVKQIIETEKRNFNL